MQDAEEEKQRDKDRKTALVKERAKEKLQGKAAARDEFYAFNKLGFHAAAPAGSEFDRGYHAAAQTINLLVDEGFIELPTPVTPQDLLAVRMSDQWQTLKEEVDGLEDHGGLDEIRWVTGDVLALVVWGFGCSSGIELRLGICRGVVGEEKRKVSLFAGSDEATTVWVYDQRTSQDPSAVPAWLGLVKID